MKQPELEENTSGRCQAQENACEQAIDGFGFTSDWLRKWREISWPITKRSSAKAKQSRNYFRHSIENCSVVEQLLGNVTEC